MSDIYGKLKIPCSQELDGASINISTIKGFSKNIILRYPETIVTLPAMEEYTISRGTYTVVKETLDCDQIVKTKEFTPFADNLNNTDWLYIKSSIQDGTFANYYKVGDYKNITLSDGQVMKMVVVNINTGTGAAATYYPANTVDFISENLINTPCSISDKNSRRASSITTYTIWTTLNEWYNKIPSDCRNTIIDKTHMYSNSAGTSSTYTSKLWLPTSIEVSNSNATSENIPYDYFKIGYSDSKRIKKYNETAQRWWTLTQFDAGTSYPEYTWSYYITDTGSSTYTISNSSNRYYIPMCFRVG